MNIKKTLYCCIVLSSINILTKPISRLIINPLSQTITSMIISKKYAFKEYEKTRKNNVLKRLSNYFAINHQPINTDSQQEFKQLTNKQSDNNNV